MREAVSILVRLGITETAPRCYAGVPSMTPDVVAQTLEVLVCSAGIAFHMVELNMADIK